MTETYRYDSFGTLTSIQSLNEDGVLAVAETALSRFLYAGEQYDATTSLYYLRARQYDTVIGRFTQEDTYLGDGRNLYVYVHNNPLKYVDPSGHGKELGYDFESYYKYSGYAYSGFMPSEILEFKEQKEEARKDLATEGAVEVLEGGLKAVAGAIVFDLSMVASLVNPGALVPASVAAGYTNMGVSDMAEGFQKIYNALTGNVDASTLNMTRDVFFGGDQEVYDKAETVLGVSNFVGGLGVTYLPFFTPSSGGKIIEYANAGSQVVDFLESVEEVVGDGSDTTALYRVMSEAEFDSLMSNGEFIPYDMAMEEKWFATTQENAEHWAEYFYPDGNYKMIEIEINSNSLTDMYYNSYLDGIGPAYCAPLDVINDAIQAIKELK